MFDRWSGEVAWHRAAELAKLRRRSERPTAADQSRRPGHTPSKATPSTGREAVPRRQPAGG